MATKKHSSSSNNPAFGGDPLSPEERKLVGMYREIDSRWEKNALFLLIQSLAYGSLGSETTNNLSWKQMSNVLGLPKEVAQ